MRVALTVLLPLLLPCVVYFSYVALTREDGRNAQAVPWFWLAGTGLVFALIALILVSTLEGAKPGSVYHPPREVEGRIVPGYFRSKEDEPSE